MSGNISSDGTLSESQGTLLQGLNVSDLAPLFNLSSVEEADMTSGGISFGSVTLPLISETDLCQRFSFVFPLCWYLSSSSCDISFFLFFFSSFLLSIGLPGTSCSLWVLVFCSSKVPAFPACTLSPEVWCCSRIPLIPCSKSLSICVLFSNPILINMSWLRVPGTFELWRCPRLYG